MLHRDIEYETVVWSTADSEDLFRYIGRMSKSYQSVCRRRQEAATLDRETFAEKLRQLKSSAYSGILQTVDKRPGWYTYTEKMLRGYVRMQAEAGGVELSGERAAPRQHIHVPTNARSGHRDPSVPKGVTLRTEGTAGQSVDAEK